jgi:hypothetical protein
MAYMTKGRGSKSQDWRSNRWIGNDLDTEDVGEAGTAVGSEGSKDEVFALLVED